MTDIKNVMNAVRLCIKKEQCILQNPKEHCPYERFQGSYENWCDDCTSKLAEDVLEILKKDEPRDVLGIITVGENTTGHCPSCDSLMLKLYTPRWCGYCGQALNWKE